MKWILSILFVYVCCTFSSAALAAPSETEVAALAKSLGWTTEDLENYLSFKEIKLDDFDNIKELKECLGTPITPDSLEQLLQSYNLTREELDILLAGFHETVQDFWFIEDLDVAIDFYQNHEQTMENLEQFLISVGITEKEKKQLYDHFKQLDAKVLQDKVYEWKETLETIDSLDQEEPLTTKQQGQLISLWKNMMDTLGLQPMFYTVDDNGKRSALKPQHFLDHITDDTVALELHDEKEKLVMDTVISPEKLSSRFAVDAADKVVRLTELSSELSTLYYSQLPNTASNHPLFLFLGYLFLLVGVLYIFLKRNKKIHDK
ncbi:processed acidic surface protein [Niallia sp. 01092]|uniref:processed acidic surface protein n=1 Tax=unclassified Niallia TaxID=2837522 RepID=UPI003FD05E38